MSLFPQLQFFPNSVQLYTTIGQISFNFNLILIFTIQRQVLEVELTKSRKGVHDVLGI